MEIRKARCVSLCAPTKSACTQSASTSVIMDVNGQVQTFPIVNLYVLVIRFGVAGKRCSGAVT